MNPAELRATLDVLVAADVHGADRAELSSLLAESSRVRGWLDRFDQRCAHRANTLNAAGRSEPAVSLLGRAGRRSRRDADRVAARAETTERLPALGAAADNDQVSCGHLDALATATRSLDDDQLADLRNREDELVAAATTQCVDTFGRTARELARRIKANGATSDADELDRQRRQANIKRWVDQITGMQHTHIELDPLRDAAWWGAVEAQLAADRHAEPNARTPWEQLKVNALVNSVGNPPPAHRPPASTAGSGDETAAARPSSPRRAVGHRTPEVIIVIDLATLNDGLHEHGVCETVDGIPIPVSTARRLCCEAKVIPVVLDGRSRPLDVGRGERTATADQRRTLAAIYASCAAGDCTVALSACRIHHIRWWWQHNGPTDIDNLIPLCEHHHHLVHEGGWTLTMPPDRTITWIRPDGTIHTTGDRPDRRPASRQRHCATHPPAPEPRRPDT